MMQAKNINQFKELVQEAIISVFERAGVLEITAPVGFYHVSKYITFVVELRKKNKHKSVTDLGDEIAYQAGLRKKDVQMYVEKGDIIIKIALPKNLWKIVNFMDYDGNAIGITEDNELIDFKFHDASPHTMVAGGTGSGKTVLMKSILTSILLKDKNVDLYVIDPHGDFSEFRPLCRKYIDPSDITEAESEVELLDKVSEQVAMVINQVVQRFRKRQQGKIKFNNKEYRKAALAGEPEAKRVVLVIDEALATEVFGSKKMGRNEWNEANLSNLYILASQARKYGVNLLIGTQKPTHEEFPAILNNIANRYVGILDTVQMTTTLLGKGSDASNLQGDGDFIWKNGRTKMQFQGTLLKDSEIEQIVGALCRK